jgi:hypothetical protein
MFVRRLGENGKRLCASGQHCSQILEMDDGHYAVVGELITEAAKGALPSGPGIGPTEGVVKVPRAVFVAAHAELPAA